MVSIGSSSISRRYVEDKLNGPSEATAGTIECPVSLEGNDPTVLIHDGECRFTDFFRGAIGDGAELLRIFEMENHCTIHAAVLEAQSSSTPDTNVVARSKGLEAERTVLDPDCAKKINGRARVPHR